MVDLSPLAVVLPVVLAVVERREKVRSLSCCIPLSEGISKPIAKVKGHAMACLVGSKVILFSAPLSKDAAIDYKRRNTSYTSSWIPVELEIL